MDRTEFLGKMLAKGKITKEQHDKAVAKLQVKADAVAKYMGKGDKLTKAELIEVIEKLK